MHMINIEDDVFLSWLPRRMHSALCSWMCWQLPSILTHDKAADQLTKLNKPAQAEVYWLHDRALYDQQINTPDCQFATMPGVQP